MNSLAFLSRQLDTRRVSPPVQPRPFNRVPTWAAFPPLRHLSPRRSSSSPALLVPAPDHPSPPAPSHLDSFLRLLLLVWTRLTHIWSTLIARLSTLYRTPVNVTSAHHSSPSLPPPRFTIDPPSQTSSASADTQDDSSRSATPPSRKPGIRQPKTLVLDLDETLIHSTSKPMASGAAGLFGRLSSLGRRNSSAGHMVEVVLQGKSTLYHVYKRPFVDFFLRTVRYLWLYVLLPRLTGPLCRSLDGTRSSFSPPPCKSTQTQSSTGWTLVVASWLNVSSEMSVLILVRNIPTHVSCSHALNCQMVLTQRT